MGSGRERDPDRPVEPDEARAQGNDPDAVRMSGDGPDGGTQSGTSAGDRTDPEGHHLTDPDAGTNRATSDAGRDTATATAPRISAAATPIPAVNGSPARSQPTSTATSGLT